MSKKVQSISKLKKTADSVFSVWIRKRDKRCVTCDSKENLQCGHYISRSCNQLRYDEVNCNAQCVACNVFKRGAMDVYALYLERKYGPEILYWLSAEKNKLKQWKVGELQEIIKKYK
jgi:hypothetical protein